ncbi:MAG TPA: lytic transglycosylase domain-containing protein [Streptosporangiaceae bacterium]|nr:lytic transglycosylase domain-containing protein [Streptosporangiaceae bacterium]
MRRLLRRSAPATAVLRRGTPATAVPRRGALATALGTPAGRALAAGGAVVILLAGTTAMGRGPLPPRPAATASASPAASTASSTASSTFHQIFVPDLLVIEPSGLSSRQLKKLTRITGVRDLVSADGAAIKLHGSRVNVLGVNPQQFRSWTPLATASDQRLWTALERGHFVASNALASRLRLHPGNRYVMTGAGQQDVILGGAAPLGISGIDALVSSQASARLGLVPGVLAMISAPGASMTALTSAVRGVTGKAATIISLRPQQQQLPVDHAASTGRPANYLQLFQASAARFCPGLSWTVLAAIGQIESGDGANMGPSSAGALGPMQFMPATWQVWGTTAFGESGPPNIMDPYDAVPSAARLLCANGAASASGLRGAIFDYNHATWYVNEVLALAQQYARD